MFYKLEKTPDGWGVTNQTLPIREGSVVKGIEKMRSHKRFSSDGEKASSDYAGTEMVVSADNLSDMPECIVGVADGKGAILAFAVPEQRMSPKPFRHVAMRVGKWPGFNDVWFATRESFYKETPPELMYQLFIKAANPEAAEERAEIFFIQLKVQNFWTKYILDEEALKKAGFRKITTGVWSHDDGHYRTSIDAARIAGVEVPNLRGMVAALKKYIGAWAKVDHIQDVVDFVKEIENE